MRRYLERSSRQQKAKSYLYRKLADCIIAICVQPKIDWVKVEPAKAIYRPRISGGCFNKLGPNLTGKLIARGQGSVRLIQTKPSHVRLNFRAGQVAISCWDTKEDAEAYNRAGYPEILKVLSKVVEGTPKVKTFEVSNSTFRKIAAKAG